MEQSEIQELSIWVNRILQEELQKSGIAHDFATARLYPNIMSVGVKGDERVYGPVAEIEIRYIGKIVIAYPFLSDLSNRITNDIKCISRVMYVLSDNGKDFKG
jgi:GMP synthase PP-ATPase subunit